MIQSKLLSARPGLIHGFSTKDDSNMAVKNVKQVDEQLSMNREQFFTRLGIDTENVVLSKQVHGDDIFVVTRNELPFASADALLTRESNIYLAVFAADCLPIFLFDPLSHTIGAVHAGWRGIAKNIIGRTLDQLIKIGARVEQILVWIGPHIKECHYDLDPARESYRGKVAAFTPVEGAIVRRGSKQFLDLTSVAMRQLTKQAVETFHIEVSPHCTACRPDLFYSYHRNPEEMGGIMMGVIGLHPSVIPDWKR